METAKVYVIYSFLKFTIAHQWTLPSVVLVLLCIMLWIGLFPVVLPEKSNTLLGSMPFLRYYVRKKNYFHKRFRKKSADYFYRQVSKYRKLVKATAKSDKLAWQLVH
jgi:hypothetical protein